MILIFNVWFIYEILSPGAFKFEVKKVGRPAMIETTNDAAALWKGSETSCLVNYEVPCKKSSGMNQNELAPRYLVTSETSVGHFYISYKNYLDVPKKIWSWYIVTKNVTSILQESRKFRAFIEKSLVLDQNCLFLRFWQKTKFRYLPKGQPFWTKISCFDDLWWTHHLRSRSISIFQDMFRKVVPNQNFY